MVQDDLTQMSGASVGSAGTVGIAGAFLSMELSHSGKAIPELLHMAVKVFPAMRKSNPQTSVYIICQYPISQSKSNEQAWTLMDGLRFQVLDGRSSKEFVAICL